MCRTVPTVAWRALLLSAVGAFGYEWAGVFSVPDTTYMWTAQKVDGAYADTAMKMAVLPAAGATQESLQELQENASSALNLTCSVVEAGGMITPKAGACYQLVFHQDLWQSYFTVNASGIAAVAFFTEHFPTEFESTAHYFKDSIGNDVEQVAELGGEGEGPAAVAAPKRTMDWGTGIGGAVIINFITLIGVILISPGISKFLKGFAVFDCVLAAFAAGALLACAFFLLLFEATHLITENWAEKEVDAIWRWGVGILAGFLLPVVVHTLTDFAHSHHGAVIEVVEGASTEEKGLEGVKQVSRSKRVQIVSAVLVGDFFHNLSDGFFLGAALKNCSSSFGWGMVGATVAHELPQELADYSVLTGSMVGIHPLLALLLNFLSGTSVVLGVIIVGLTDVDSGTIGMLLAFGGGVYINIAAVECIPRVQDAKISKIARLGCLLAFLVGATVIGLILIDHEHCAPPAVPGEAPAAGGHPGH